MQHSIQRPKVLFIMHMPPPVHGAAMVGKWIHDSEYINSSFDCHYVNLSISNGMSDIGNFRWNKIRSFITLYNTVKRCVRETAPDLVYITSNTAGMPFVKDSIIVNEVKRMGYPVLVHFHNKGVSRNEHSPIWHMLYKRFFDKLKVLLIVPVLYEDIKTFKTKEDVYVCPNGTPLTLSQEIEAERHSEVPEIVFLSNMIISKGVLDLLSALQILRDRQYSCHCTLIGAETPELTKTRIGQEISSRNLAGMVDYVGPRYGAEKDSYLRKADIMAFPTYYPKECFPLVILEAMEYKLPVVSTFEAGIPYSVINGRTGLLGKARNPNELSHNLATLLDDQQLRWKMGEEGYKLRKEKFCLGTFERNFVEVISRVINDFNNIKDNK